MNEHKLVEALKVAQRWLANSQPIVDLDGPKPLPLIAEAIAEYERVPHSKSEYKRLTALGVDVVEPFTPYVTGPDEFGSVYVYFQPNRKGAVYGTHGKAPVTVNVDYDHEGNLYGIEILGVNAPPPPTAATEG